MKTKTFLGLGALAAMMLAGCAGNKAAEASEATLIEHGDTMHYGQTELLQAYMTKLYGENQKIEGDYNKDLAVKCVNGTFVGKMQGPILSFKGIPFVGEQPVGPNRFKKPVPFKEDDGVYEAYYFGKACPQPGEGTEPSVMYKVGEDCLYLNVWKNTADKTAKKPVMVWIHGGGFKFGGTVDPAYDGYNFLLENPDVIYVSIAYRLGMLGYSHLKDLPGGEAYPDAQNCGVLDQLMALKWVHENIEQFGGDPNNVTIYGQSAGGGSVSTLALIPEARQYINRVISQSGTNGFTRSPEEAKKAVKDAMALTGVKTLEEYVNLPVEELVKASGAKALGSWPERDGQLIPTEPWEYMGSGAVKDIDFMNGTSKDEVNYFVLVAGQDKDAFCAMFQPLFEGKVKAIKPEEAKKANEYMAQAGTEKWDQISKFGTQVIFAAPAIRQTEELVKGGGKVYHYYTVVPGYGDLGATHSVEISAQFNNLDYQLVTNRDLDRKYARLVQRMWVNFAKTGDPSVSAEESPYGKELKWEPYNTEKKPVMVIDEFNTHMSTEAECKIVDWERIYPLADYYLFLVE